MSKQRHFYKTHLPLIVGISGISGAGKSTLVNAPKEPLCATTLFLDDYDNISKSPEDLVAWYRSSRRYEDWSYPSLANTLDQLKQGKSVICPATKRELCPTKYVLFDAPLGYCHNETGKYITFLVSLDTPLNIALAHRLVRDYKNNPNQEAMIADLEQYLSASRPLFFLSPEKKHAISSLMEAFQPRTK